MLDHIIPDAVTLGRVSATNWMLDHVAAACGGGDRQSRGQTRGPAGELVLQPGKPGVSATIMLQRAILRYANIPDLDKVEVLACAELRVLRGLERHWSAICALADVLLEDGCIEGDRDREILISCVPGSL
jgi:hypothetical protein